MSERSTKSVRTRPRAIDPRIDLRREEIWSGLLAIFLLAISIWALATGFLLQHKASHYETDREAHDVLREIHSRQAEAIDSWNAIEHDRARPGVLIRLRDRRELNALSGRIAPLVEGWERQAFEELSGGVDSTLALMYESVLLRFDARAAESIRDTAAAGLFARSFDLREQAEAIAARNEHVESALEASLAPHLEEVLNGLVTLTTLAAALLVLSGLVIWKHRRLRRELDRSLNGALLVEEMLEAYGLELERVNRELERATLWKLQVLADTTRDLEPRLSTIRTALIGLRDAPESSDTRLDLIQTALEATTAANEQTRSLVELSGTDDSWLAQMSTSFDFNLLLDRVLARTRVAIEKKGLALLLVPPAEGWPRVCADPDRLGQIIEGLIRNALEATDHGSLRLTGRILTEPAAALRLDIADTGRGIEPGRIADLFRPMSRQDDDEKPLKRGLGLGLSNLLMRAMGGGMGLESEGLGAGTRAWVTIPLQRGAAGGDGSGADRQAA